MLDSWACATFNIKCGRYIHIAQEETKLEWPAERNLLHYTRLKVSSNIQFLGPVFLFHLNSKLFKLFEFNINYSWSITPCYIMRR